MQQELSNFDFMTTVLQVTAFFTLAFGCVTTYFGILLHKRVTGKISLLWYATFVIPLLLPLAVYITGKKSKQICEKKNIKVDYEFGYTTVYASILAIALALAFCIWFSNLSSPDLSDLKILSMGLTGSILLHAFTCLLTPLQFYSRKKAIQIYIDKRKLSKQA